jgi:hypothetical protein
MLLEDDADDKKAVNNTSQLSLEHILIGCPYVKAIMLCTDCHFVCSVERGDGSYDSTSLFLYIRQLL